MGLERSDNVAILSILPFFVWHSVCTAVKFFYMFLDVCSMQEQFAALHENPDLYVRFLLFHIFCSETSSPF